EADSRPTPARGARRKFGTGRRLGAQISGLADRVASWAESETQHGSGVPAGPTTRRCPYCTERIDLRRCAVVSVAGAATQGGTGFDDGGESTGRGDSDPGAGRGPDVTINGYPVLREAQAGQNGQTATTMFGELLSGGQGPTLTPLTQIASPARMPRRLCELCRHVLPPELDELDTRFLAVVGITGAGKTHYLAQVLTEATRRGTLVRFGCTEFAATDADKTAATLHTSYYTPVFRRRSVFEPTLPTRAPRQFSFTATVRGQRFLLITHDIAGESFADHDQRAQQLTFLRHADAVIFLLDPIEFDALRARLPDDLIGPDKPADQVHLLRQCLRELDETSQHEIPVRLVVAKSDLIADYCGMTGSWTSPAGPDWQDDIEKVSSDVQQLLIDLGESEIVRVLATRERTLFHAVSALGAPPGEDGLLSPAEPLRCSDPLGTALLGMAMQPPAGR
ncbi:MAG: TRAFAC clade GTPase domain-containing protein, partial [Streptosporangiaceae bacterium]